MSWATALALVFFAWLALRLRRRLLARDVDYTTRCWGNVRAVELREATDALDELSDAAQRASRRD